MKIQAELFKGVAMNSKELAAYYDAKKQPIEAAQAYEEVINSSLADLDIYLKLAVLYLVCNDLGYAAAHNLPYEFVNNAWNRVEQLLDEAKQRFGHHPEIQFWRMYFRFIFLGEEFSEEECKRLLGSEELSVPYLYLFAFTGTEGKAQYYSEAKKLLEQVIAGSTEKERYIKSVLNSAFRPGS